MIKMAHCLVLALMAGTSMNCTSPAKTQTLVVQHYQVPCQGESTMMCYLVKKQDQEDWEYFYDEIQGLDYEWGYVYTLEVSIENITNPPQDGSSIATKVEKVLKKEKVAEGTTFELPLAVEGTPMLTQQGKSWTYFNTIEVVSTPDLDSLIKKSSTGVFEQQAGKSNILRLVSVK
jgi:hypothetical protein